MSLFSICIQENYRCLFSHVSPIVKRKLYHRRLWHLLQNLLFYYENETCSRPSGVVLLEGCYCDQLITAKGKEPDKQVRNVLLRQTTGSLQRTHFPRARIKNFSELHARPFHFYFRFNICFHSTLSWMTNRNCIWDHRVIEVYKVRCTAFKLFLETRSYILHKKHKQNSSIHSLRYKKKNFCLLSFSKITTKTDKRRLVK